MTLITIAPIVEGHGEVAAIRTLLERTLASLSDACMVRVLQPIRVSKSKIVRDQDELLRAIDLASLKLLHADADVSTVLLLLDADRDLACVLAPQLLQIASSQRSHIDIACVLPVVEYETWLVAGAETLGDYLVDAFRDAIPADPEASGVGKGWIQHYFNGDKYSETVDQVRLTASFDVLKARSRSKSFDKLCRELEVRCDPADQ